MAYNKEHNEKIAFRNKYLEFMELVFEGKEMGFYHERVSRTYLRNAISYAKLDMIDESIESLIKSLNHIIKLESSTITKYELLLLYGHINDMSKTQTNTTKTNKEIFLNQINLKVMEKVRLHKRFKEVEELVYKLK